MDKEEKSIGFHISGGGGNTVKAGKIEGFDTAVSMENTTDNKVSVEHASTSPSEMQNAPPDSGDEWYKKPVGILVLSVAAIVVAAIILSALNLRFHWIKP